MGTPLLFIQAEEIYIRNEGTTIQTIGHAVLQHFGLQISLLNHGRVAAGLRFLGFRV